MKKVLFIVINEIMACVGGDIGNRHTFRLACARRASALDKH